MNKVIDTNKSRKNALIGKIEAIAAKARRQINNAKETLSVETTAENFSEFYVVKSEPCFSVKIDMPSLENPFYSLAKRADTKVRLFKYNVQQHGKSESITIEIIPSVIGGATIYDKDILTYCSSLIMARLKSNPDAPVYRRVRFSTRYIVNTHRVKSRKNIDLKAA